MKLIQKFASAVKLCLHSFDCYYDTVSVKSVGARLISAACAFIVLLSYVSYPIMTVAVDEEAAFQQLSFELYPNEQESEKTVTLNGMMPKDASAEAVDVTNDFSDVDSFDIENNDETENPTAAVLAAYNITITDGENEYQPGEENPIHVEITNPEISTDNRNTLWHIMDDGTREQITDFSIEDGKISFYATGFSVYAIVSAPDPYVPDSADYAASIADLTGERASSGLYLYYTTSAGVKKYFSSSLNSKNCLVEVENKASAALWYFENDGDDYQIYTYVNGVKKYIKTKSGNEIKLDSTGDLINISNSTQANSFIFKKKGANLWLQHSNGGGGIRYYTDNKNVVNSSIGADYIDAGGPPDDRYNLDGKTYGFMNYSGGTLGDALMAEGDDNYLDMLSLVVRKETGSETLYVAQDSDISLWTFHSISGDEYKISTEVNGQTKYLKLDNGTLSLVDEAEASAITVTTNNEHKIKLSSDGSSVTFGSNGFTASTTSSTNRNQWLYLVETVGLSDEDYITYYADKVGISDVPDGSSVLVYTRVWDDVKKAYEFYAVGHDGTLYPCYERGDNITWVGTQINTLLWDFTEYHYDDGTPNYYYELYNPYSQKYIAPQIANGQILSDNKIGINLPGRRDGEYYSDIIAWDDPYYTYAALKSDIENGNVVTTSRSDAETYYFALIESPKATLTKVDTIDNNQFGITMKMVDFPVQTNTNGGFYGVQSDFLGHWSGRKNGILSTDLDENGYPKVTANGKNLGDLYAGSSVNTAAADTPYAAAKEVNHLFIESIYNASGYFEFDSCQNFATLRNENNVLGSNFTVYKELGTTNTAFRSTLSHGQFFPYNNITAGVYSTTNPENLYSALAVPGNATMGLLPESDPRKYEKLHAVNGSPNYYNGMEMEASFVQTPSGKDAWGHDIVFEFTGDDDFWFYVDGELVLDLGGIHSALAGRVNFATGDVVVDGTQTNLRTIFKQNYETRNPNATTEEVNEYLANYFNEGENIFKDYSAHTMRIFYMERGAGASNLHMRFNLSSVTPGDVILTKTVSGSNDLDFNLVEYPYQIWYIDEENGSEKLLRNNDANISVTYKNATQRVRYLSTYTPPNSTQSYDSVYFLNPGKSADIHFPANTIKYRIVECGINSEVYDTVKVNGETITGASIGNTNRKYYSTDWLMVSERPTVTFDNHVDPDSLRTLSFQKKLFDEYNNELTAEQDPTTFSFRLYLSNGVDDNLMLANMYTYYVKNPAGYLCRWDANTQKFVPTNKTEQSTLTDAEREQVAFDTSMNGSISKIPAGYTVEVPNLPVGMKFKVEERASEIPLGYKLVEYDRESGTYHAEDGDTLNSGWVRANESPKMYIHNKRGWELEANKVWSDRAFTSSHDSIYTAVYIGNDLMPGSVKKITHPNTSVRYFLDDLQEGTTFEDYKIYEVELLNPTFDANGELTGYDSIQRKLNDGDLTTINAVAKNASTPSAYSYATTYNRGTPRSSSSATTNNIRTDTITNTRTGGVVITLYDMNTREPLSGGTFKLSRDGTVLGMFISDENGRVTIMYDFDREQDYVLTEVSPPNTYIGLPNSAVFSIGSDDSVTISGNDAIWQTGYKSPNAGDSLIAYIDVFNKPFTLQAKKVDSETNDPLADAHFSLYRSVTAIGGTVKDVAPIPGYEDLVTLADGVIPRIDNTLQPGKYYLTEKTPPSGYKLLSEDIVFTVSDLGVVTIESNGHEDYLTTTGSSQSANYVITVPNETAAAELTITKTVEGAFCNEYKDFTFTLSVDGAAPTDEYEWTKNDVEQNEKLHNGSEFTLRHGDVVKIMLPTRTDLTITENSVNYIAKFTLGNNPQETLNTKTFQIEEDTTLAVLNTLDGIVPTGIQQNLTIILLTIGALAGVAFVIKHQKKTE